MILPFSTQLNGKPNDFVSKIWESIIPFYSEQNKGVPIFKYPKEYLECSDKKLLSWYKQKPKLHTIREDNKNRWKQGVKIDFFINTRKKDMFRFAPVLNVISIQTIEIIHQEYLNDLIIKIDGRKLTIDEKQNLAWNDGFENLYEFISYFKEDFSGKIIHWTDYRY